jgi:hypothetical protein
VLKGMAGTTGLEPAASAVTGQRSNQLNYVPTFIFDGVSLKPVSILAFHGYQWIRQFQRFHLSNFLGLWTAKEVHVQPEEEREMDPTLPTQVILTDSGSFRFPVDMN